MNGGYDKIKLIYVCSPYADEVEKNIQSAKNYCRYVIDCGKAPIAVHLLYPQFLDDNNPVQRKQGIACGLKILSACDELWKFGNIISNGMQAEINEANKLCIPIKNIEWSEELCISTPTI